MVESAGKEEVPHENDQPPVRRLRSIVIVLGTALLLTIAVFSWADLYRSYLELTPPAIELVEVPRGIGLSPVSFVFSVIDPQAGLSEVQVRLTQQQRVKELLHRALDGSTRAETVTIDFPGERSDLEEGSADLEIIATDRSLWNSTARKALSVRVDFHRPRIDILSAAPSVREGSAQLVFYRAFDEALAFSGLKAGAGTFSGFPARALDKDLEDKNLNVVLYAVPLGTQAGEHSMKIFAEDMVGNAASLPLTVKVSVREARKTRIELSNDFLRGQAASLADQNLQKMESWAAQSGQELKFNYRRGSEERLLEKFQLADGLLRQINEEEILSLLRGPEYTRYWQGTFRHPYGKVLAAFGDEMHYFYAGVEAGKSRQQGYIVIPPRGDTDVTALNDGIVVFVSTVGVYGRVVGVAHGLGLVSLYGYLYSAGVKTGDVVTQGQVIGTAGSTGLAAENGLYLEMRVAGIPIDPSDWWDSSRYGQNVAQRINEVKRALGIPIYKTLD